MRSPLALLSAAVFWTASGASASAQAPEPRWTSDRHRFEVHSVAFSPDGKLLASAGGYFGPDLKPGEIHLWEVASGKLLRSLKGHAGGVWSVAFSPDGKALASASADRTVKPWDAATGAETATLEGHGDWVRSVAFSPDGKSLASAGNDRTVRLWDVGPRRGRATLRGHKGPVACLAFSPDGEVLASNAFDGSIKVWDVGTGREETSLATQNVSYGMAFSPGGRSLALGGSGGVTLWERDTWKVRANLKAGGKSIYGVAFSPGGRTLAAACWDRKVRIMDAKDGRALADLPHGDGVLCVASSPDEKALASGTGASAPFRVNVWDVGEGPGRAAGKD